MKIFVSGQINDIKRIRSVQAELVDAGHTITHDWTHNEAGEKMLATTEDKLRDPIETGHRAQLDIQGVIDCDAYILCTDNVTSGKGMYVELGAALALCEVRSTPLIFLIGKMNHMSVFYFHPRVIQMASVKDVIDYLQQH